jgi:hypothetical protein
MVPEFIPRKRASRVFVLTICSTKGEKEDTKLKIKNAGQQVKGEK